MLHNLDCVWGEWASWGSCSKTCGPGTIVRTRAIKVQATNGGEKCTGESKEHKDCQIKPCDTFGKSTNALVCELMLFP